MKPSTFNYERFLELQAENKELQAQLDEYDEIAAEYGIDGKTMLTLAKSQTRTAQDNVELMEQLEESQRRADAAVEDIEAMLKQDWDADKCWACKPKINCGEERRCIPEWRGTQDEKGEKDE